MPPAPLRVEGLAQLTKAFALADKELSNEMRDTLKDVAKPVQYDAERLAVDSIPRMTLPWSRMRIGVTATSVYVAPKQRGVKGGKKARLASSHRRPNLFGLLLDRSLEPALEQNEDLVLREMEQMLETVGRKWEHV